MSKTFMNDTKCCATCANWAGPRTLNVGGSSVKVDATNDRGKCYANVFCGVTQGQSSTEGRGCSKYQKWSALR